MTYQINRLLKLYLNVFVYVIGTYSYVSRCCDVWVQDGSSGAGASDHDLFTGVQTDLAGVPVGSQVSIASAKVYWLRLSKISVYSERAT